MVGELDLGQAHQQVGGGHQWAEQMHRLAGQPVHLLSPLVPSTYLLVGLAKVEFADHQKFTLKWAIAISLLLMVGSLLFGLYPLAA
mgnify:CR=1 FL=1